MDYLFHQHYNLQQAPHGMPVVLLAEPEPEALALYARHLTEADLLVQVCFHLNRLADQVRLVSPQLLIINPASDIVTAISVLKSIGSDYPGLPVITVGSPVPDPYIDRLMAAGVRLHINRTFSQPKDIATAALQVLGRF